MGPGPNLRRHRLRLLVTALLVPLVGAACGFAAFVVENSHQTWRPVLEKTASGWRIAGRGPKLQPHSPMLCAGRLAWNAGPYTLVMDLDSAHVKLVGSAHDPSSLWPPFISDRYVAWQEDLPGDTTTSVVFVYDIVSRRRVRLAEDVSPSTVGVVGDTVVWNQGTAPMTLVGEQIATRERRVIAEGVAFPRLVRGALLAWGLPETSSQPYSILIRDTLTGAERVVTPPRGGLGDSFASFHLSDDWLVWLQSTRVGTAVMALDLGTGTTTEVARGRISSVALDEDTVVWAAQGPADAQPLMTTIVGRSLDAGPTFTVAREAAIIDSLSACEGVVAWRAAATDRVENDWVETVRLPR